MIVKETRMDREQRRAYRKALRLENSQYSDTLQEVPVEQWVPFALKVSAHETMIGVWRSKHFLVQIYREPQSIVRLSVMRSDIDRTGHYKDGITWDELQQLKSECGFGDRDAVEVFPPDADVVDVANIRHLWVMPDRLPFVWREEDGAND